MHRTRRPHPLLVVATVVGLLLSGCGGDEDVDEATFADHLYERTGADESIVPREVADCITEKVFEEWADDQGEINRIYRAADEDELGNETRDRLNLFNQECFEGVGEGDAQPDDETKGETDEDDGGETSTTTADSGSEQGEETPTTEGSGEDAGDETTTTAG